MANVRTLSAYGLDQALIGVVPSPIVSKRNPTATDIAPLGQIWVNKSANTVYFLSSVVNKIATWATQASVAGALNVGGVITAGTGLVVTANGEDIAAGGLRVHGGDVTIATGSINMTAGQINLAGPVQILTGAGVPANGLALEVGDIYINTTAATAATRIYVATAAGAWTNVTCAA